MKASGLRSEPVGATWGRISRFAWLAVAMLGLATGVLAQTPDPARRGATTLLMGTETFVSGKALTPPSRVRVPPNEQLTLTMPADWTYPIQWRKDGRVIPGATGRTLFIPLTTTSDSGLYTVTGAPSPIVTTGISLDVVGEGHTGNFSVRVDLPAGAAPQIIGFVAEGRTTNQLLIRAVGPSLRQFGIERPAARPRFRIYDAKGQEYVAVIQNDIARLSPQKMGDLAGAFPLLPGAADSQQYYPLPAGAYTIHVFDDSGAGGTVLLEVYKIPAEAFTPLSPIVIIDPGSVILN